MQLFLVLFWLFVGLLSRPFGIYDGLLYGFYNVAGATAEGFTTSGFGLWVWLAWFQVSFLAIQTSKRAAHKLKLEILAWSNAQPKHHQTRPAYGQRRLPSHNQSQALLNGFVQQFS